MQSYFQYVFSLLTRLKNKVCVFITDSGVSIMGFHLLVQLKSLYFTKSHSIGSDYLEYFRHHMEKVNIHAYQSWSLLCFRNMVMVCYKLNITVRSSASAVMTIKHIFETPFPLYLLVVIWNAENMLENNSRVSISSQQDLLIQLSKLSGMKQETGAPDWTDQWKLQTDCHCDIYWLKQNSCQFANNNINLIFMHGHCCISINIFFLAQFPTC